MAAVFERVLIDGVPVYAGGAPGPVAAGLAFGVGTAHEPFLWRGVTALVAELAASEVDGVRFRVGDTETRFLVEAPARQAAEALGAICAQLRAIDGGDLADLADTMLSEPAAIPEVADQLASFRFGADVFGRRMTPRCFLYAPALDDARTWVNERFTRANAVAWSSGPLDPALTFSLPAEEQPDRISIPEPLCAVPAWLPHDWLLDRFRDRIDFTFVTAHLDATRVAMRALVDEVHERLADGPLRSAPIDVTLNAAGDACYGVGSLTVRTNGNEAIEALLSSLDDFAELGPDPEERSDAIGAITSWARDVANTDDVVQMLAIDELHTGTARLLDTFCADLERPTGDDIAETLADVRDSLLLAVPSDCEIVAPTPGAFRFPSVPHVRGKEYEPAPDSPNAEARLVIGSDGVSYRDDTDETAVLFDECIAVIAFPDDARWLFAHDGSDVAVDPLEWLDSDEMRDRIDTAIPAEIVVHATRPFHDKRDEGVAR